MASAIAPNWDQKQAMNGLMRRFFERKSRTATLSSFVLTAGSVDAVMGLVGMKESLLLVGLGMVGGAIALQWLNRLR